MKSTYYAVKVCINCKKEFLAYKKARHGRRGGCFSRKYIRPSNVKTCSHKCSIEYTRRDRHGTPSSL